MLSALGLGRGALDRFLTKPPITYSDSGPSSPRPPTRAGPGPFRAGASAALNAPAAVHSDMQRGFIRAETISCDKLLEAGSWVAARDQGLVRSEGKDYRVADGDVMEFKFNV